MQWRKRCKWCS